jgi:hypothetical protein
MDKKRARLGWNEELARTVCIERDQTILEDKSVQSHYHITQTNGYDRLYKKGARQGWKVKSSVGILRHKFNKRLDSFVPCYSQSHLLSDLKE